MKLIKPLAVIAVVLLVAVTFSGLATVPATAQSAPVLTSGQATAAATARPAASGGLPVGSPARAIKPTVVNSGTVVWNNTTVDSGFTGDSSIKLDAQGFPHISYTEWQGDTNVIKYAYEDAAGWHNTSVDSGDASSIALDAHGYAHISYEFNHTLKYASQNATGWSTVTVDSNGMDGYTSLALDAQGNAHISYQGWDYMQRNGEPWAYDVLKYAWQGGSGWQITTVDSDSFGQPTGMFTSIALDSHGYAQISYMDVTNYALKYAWQDGSGWHNVMLDSSSSSYMLSYTSIALDARDYAHITYDDAGNSLLKYAWQDASGWHVTSVDNNLGIHGGFESIAVDSQNYSHISYATMFGGSSGTFTYAWQNASGWYITPFDTGPVGVTSIAVDAGASPHISYADNGALKYAYLPNLTANYSYIPDRVYVRDTVTFNATNSTPNDTITAYKWDFGDGKTGTGKVAIHAYQTPGNYTANLTVSNAEGAFNTTSQNITVGDKWALIIGIGHYEQDHYFSDLNGPPKDVSNLTSFLLNNWHFNSSHITILSDSLATKAGIKTAISDLQAKSSPNDLVIFDYGGHGLRDRTRTHGYITTYDTTVTNYEADPASMIRADELGSWLSPIPCRDMLCIFDNCFSGYMGPGMGLTSSASTSGPHHLVLMATDKRWPEPDGRPYSGILGYVARGQFTYYLVLALLNPALDLNHDNWISAREAFNKAYSDIQGLSRRRERVNPQIYPAAGSDLDVDYIGPPPSAGAQSVAPAPNVSVLQSANVTSSQSLSSASLNASLTWSVKPGAGADTAPAVANNVLYVGSNDGNVYALNASSGKPLWNYTTGGPVAVSPAVANSTVFAGSTNVVYALNATTGAKKWGVSIGGNVTSSPTVANGAVFVGSDDGNVYALSASSGSKLWSYATGEVDSAPTFADGVLYVGSWDHNVYAINAATGTKLWNYTAMWEVTSSPAVSNGVVYVGGSDWYVYALNASTGALVWQLSTGESVASPTVANSVVYVGSWDGNAYAINATSGATTWNAPVGYISSPPAYANGVVWVNTNLGTLYALDPATGATLWTYDTSGFDHYGPTVSNGAVYVVGGGGYVYAIGNQTSAHWGPWTSLGGQVLNGTSPAAYSSGGQTGVFVVGTNHQLYWSTGSGWTSLGGTVTSSPAASSSGTGVIDVFARGTNGALYQKHYASGSWGAWTSLGGQLPAGTSPAASSWGSGRVDVFVQGTNGALYHKSYTGSWSAWESLGGQLSSSPGAVSRQPNVIDVFVRGTNGAVYQKTYSSGTWGGWTSLGGQIPAGTTPAASGWTDHLDLFVQGTNGALYQKTWNASGGWGSWTSLGGQLTSSPAATSPAVNQIAVFARSTNGALYEKVYA